MSEYRFQIPPYKNTLTDFKIFRSLGKPVVIIPNAGASAKFLQRTDLTDLMKIYTAEAYASGEFIYPPYSILANSPKGWQFFDGDMNEIYPYYDFIMSNKKYYENVNSAADVAVFFSYATQKDKLNLNAYSNFYGISNYLLDTHFQFDVLFAGDNIWMDDKLTIDHLKQYLLIILPNVGDISDTQLDLLLKYIEMGGKVFAFGETAVRNEFTQSRNESPIADLLVDGVHDYGQGKFNYSVNNYGTAYQQNPDAATRQKISDNLTGLNIENILTNASEKVSILEYWNSSSEASVIHLINQDYDSQGEHINPQHNISMEIALNNKLVGKDLVVYYSSPDWRDRRELKFNIADNKIRFTIPDLDTYGVIFIGDKNK